VDEATGSFAGGFMSPKAFGTWPNRCAISSKEERLWISSFARIAAEGFSLSQLAVRGDIDRISLLRSASIIL
jgi:hypothetical protein